MDDELQHLEAELKALRPAPVSVKLRHRVQRDLAQSDPDPERVGGRPRGRLLWWLAALPAAAAVALMFNHQGTQSPVAPPPARESVALTAAPAGDALKPVLAENVLYATDDEGMVTLDDGTPARRRRLHYVDTITWRNPRTNASLTWSLPREEVRIVPVSFQ